MTPTARRRDALAVAAPPAVWFVHLNVSYLLVPPSCRAGHRWFLLLATVVGLAVLVPAARRSAGARRAADTEGLQQFVATWGGWFTALFALAIVLVGASAVVVGPCR